MNKLLILLSLLLFGSTSWTQSPTTEQPKLTAPLATAFLYDELGDENLTLLDDEGEDTPLAVIKTANSVRKAKSMYRYTCRASLWTASSQGNRGYRIRRSNGKSYVLGAWDCVGVSRAARFYAAVQNRCDRRLDLRTATIKTGTVRDEDVSRPIEFSMGIESPGFLKSLVDNSKSSHLSFSGPLTEKAAVRLAAWIEQYRKNEHVPLEKLIPELAKLNLGSAKLDRVNVIDFDAEASSWSMEMLQDMLLALATPNPWVTENGGFSVALEPSDGEIDEIYTDDEAFLEHTEDLLDDYKDKIPERYLLPPRPDYLDIT